jgi:hypothetical protein
MNLKWKPAQSRLELSRRLFGPGRAEVTKSSNNVGPNVDDAIHGHVITVARVLHNRESTGKSAYADLFVTLRLDFLFLLVMSPAVRTFTRGMFGFAKIIVIDVSVCLLSAIVQSFWFALCCSS